MTVSTGLRIELDDSFARALPELAVAIAPSPAPDPATVFVNDELASSLGLDAVSLRLSAGAALLTGTEFASGAHPVAQAYAGHQFGGYSPRLGDGRAVLLGEIVHAGRRVDIHLKGSGRTPFARGGDGRAALGPMLREYLISEAMHALGIPTTRSLAVATTGEMIVREVHGRAREVPGAVLTRVASSHLRVGSFQYAASLGDVEVLRRLTAFALERHVPRAVGTASSALVLYEHVIAAQARLVAQWMAVGFIHGVMNTDNMTISGETIDYGPCAFMDAYDPATVYSSIDQAGRYAYGNQPSIAAWNLARLGEALLPLIADEADVTADAAVEFAVERLQRFGDLFHASWVTAMAAKLGVDTTDPDAPALVSDLLELMASQRIDYTSALRSLSSIVRGDDTAARARFADVAAFEEWARRWRPRVTASPAAMDRANPRYVARNHLVEEALDAATDGELEPFTTLLDVVSHPFDDQPGKDRYADPAPAEFSAGYRTFCGT